MGLDDLLSSVDGIGGDSFVRSAPPKRPEALKATPEAPVAPAKPPLARPRDVPAPTPASEPPSPMLDLVLDVEFEVIFELGSAQVPLKQLLHPRPGERYALDRQPDQPLDIYVGDRLIARGEALLVDGDLAVRLTEFVADPLDPALLD